LAIPKWQADTAWLFSTRRLTSQSARSGQTVPNNRPAFRRVLPDHQAALVLALEYFRGTYTWYPLTDTRGATLDNRQVVNFVNAGATMFLILDEESARGWASRSVSLSTARLLKQSAGRERASIAPSVALSLLDDAFGEVASHAVSDWIVADCPRGDRSFLRWR